MDTPFLSLEFHHYHEINQCNHYNHDFECFQATMISQSSSLKTILNSIQFNTDEHIGTEKTMLLCVALIEKIRFCDHCMDELSWINDFVGSCLSTGFLCLLKLLNNYDISLIDYLSDKQQNNEIRPNFIEFADQHGYSTCLLMYYLFLWYDWADFDTENEFYHRNNNDNYYLYHHLIAITEMLYHNYDKWKNSQKNKYILNKYCINCNNLDKDASTYGASIVENMQCCKIYFRVTRLKRGAKLRWPNESDDPVNDMEDAIVLAEREFDTLYPVSLDQLLDYVLNINYNDCQISRQVIYHIVVSSSNEFGACYSFPINIIIYKTLLYLWKKDMEKEKKHPDRVLNINASVIAVATLFFFHHCIDWNMFSQKNQNSDRIGRHAHSKIKQEKQIDIVCQRINRMFPFDWLTSWLVDEIHKSTKAEGDDWESDSISLYIFQHYFCRVFVDLIGLGQRWDVARIFAVECNNCVELKNSVFHLSCKIIANRSKKKRTRREMTEDCKNEQCQKYTRAIHSINHDNDNGEDNDNDKQAPYEQMIQRLNDKLTNFFTKSDHNNSKAHFHWRNLVIGKRCQTCHFRNEKLRKCKHCKNTFYCSRKCQKIGWNLKNHKNFCVKLSI